MAFLIKDVEQNGTFSAYVESSFEEGKSQLYSEGYHIISAEENAQLRILVERNAGISTRGNWISEAIILIKGKGKFITKNSPILTLKDLSDLGRGTSLVLREEQLETALRGSIKISDSQFSIPSKRFGEDELTNYLFGNLAKEYGLFLKDAKIKNMPINSADFRDKPFARQLWFDCLNEQSGIVGEGGYAGGFVRGIKTLDAI